MNEHAEARPQSDSIPLVSLHSWLASVGVTSTTGWRWRKKGLIKTVNICGRQYITKDSIKEFLERASAGEFAATPQVPNRQRKEFQ